MIPEARDYLAKAADDLADARKILGIGLAKPAARSAYYVAFHAAEALLIARTGKIAKTHAGIRTALAELLHATPGSDRELLTFLARAYKYKELGDYGVGRAANVTVPEAEALIDGAAGFLERAIVLVRETSDGAPTQKDDPSS